MAKSSATLTIRNVPLRVVRNLKSIAKRRHRSMEQEVRDLLEEYPKLAKRPRDLP
jgi:plasmid stability protein